MTMAYAWRGPDGRDPIRHDDGRIDCEIRLPDGEWVPFTADGNDPHEPAAATLKAILAAETAGEVAIADAPASVAAGPPDLSPAQFEWLLAFTGLDEVWTAAEDRARARGDRALYADLRARRADGGFGLAAVLAVKNAPALSEAAAEAAPGADLSDTAIRRAWELAASRSAPPLP